MNCRATDYQDAFDTHTHIHIHIYIYVCIYMWYDNIYMCCVIVGDDSCLSYSDFDSRVSLAGVSRTSSVSSQQVEDVINFYCCKIDIISVYYKHDHCIFILNLSQCNQIQCVFSVISLDI